MTGVRPWVGRDGVAATARNVYVAQAFSNIVSAIDVAVGSRRAPDVGARKSPRPRGGIAISIRTINVSLYSS